MLVRKASPARRDDDIREDRGGFDHRGGGPHGTVHTAGSDRARVHARVKRVPGTQPPAAEPPHALNRLMDPRGSVRRGHRAGTSIHCRFPMCIMAYASKRCLNVV